jgi:hypothetical protein
MPVFFRAPGIFTQDQSGCGQAAALNVHADGSVSLNTPQDSFDPLKDVAIEFYLTGLGAVADRKDGVPWQFNAQDSVYAPLIIGDDYVSLNPLAMVRSPYSGPAPGTVGGDQVNATFPPDFDFATWSRCRVPVWVAASSSKTQLTTISIHPGGGACADPAIDPAGMVVWQRTVLSDVSGVTTSTGVSAQFESDLSHTLPCRSWATLTCYSGPSMCATSIPHTLDLGQITASGKGFAPSPLSRLDVYRAALPNDLTFGGSYTVTATGGKDIGAFSATANLPLPITLTSTFPPGSAQSSGVGRLYWTGGDASSWVAVELLTRRPGQDPAVLLVGYAPASDGSAVYIQIGSPFDIPPGIEEELLVFQMPASVPSQEFTAPGAFAAEQRWRYVWDFRGLVSSGE